MSQPELLAIRDLSVSFPAESGRTTVVRDLSLTVSPGETVALVGESGSGKSVTSLAVTRLLDYGPGRIDTGEILYRDRAGTVRDLVRADAETMRRLRGPEIAMVFQQPMSSLNPVMRIGEQIAEAIVQHRDLGWSEAEAEALQLLERVRIPDARRQLKRYPFEISGGMRQRVMIAIALASRPRLLIADEPTTALDVTVQAQVLRLLRELRDDLGTGLLFITHDMGVVAELADRVAVMRGGDRLEEGSVAQIFAAPVHPYTRSLLAAVPVLGSLADTPLPAPFTIAPEEAVPQDTVVAGAPTLELRELVTRFDVRNAFGMLRAHVHAVEHVSFDIHPGETLALVGESGCGKSTLGRSIVRLETPRSGQIVFEGQDVLGPEAETNRALRRGIQYVFQDPYSALDPRLTVGFSVAEPIRTHALRQGAAVTQRVGELLELVGLPPHFAARYPHELSGGQCQRVGIARALASEPRLIIADEAVAALDVSIRAQIVNLLMSLQRRLGLSCLFISHDMAVVERVSHRVAVMYLGQIVEIGPRQAVLSSPQHAYTRRLLAAVPIPDPARRRRELAIDDSEVPSPLRAPDDIPTVAPLVEVGPGHFVARHPVGGLY
ncbi:ABC transporter ATP-binding protein [Bosea sp. BH3]|uniref:ABC transporter ATP-binding protein n=1 Tax=Bosea sp. BH3 TaxID=2871701 RepID=UPI0021CB0F28|nr:ABC transporter ATP-binding protein [Bosea sp. BH3]MCU4181822.1 ABC transporter ATP-binding protein [Bosea sp. BH3]